MPDCASRSWDVDGLTAPYPNASCIKMKKNGGATSAFRRPTTH